MIELFIQGKRGRKEVPTAANRQVTDVIPKVVVDRFFPLLPPMSVGVRPPPPEDHRADFAEFRGIWTADDASDFETATTDFETVDKADWP